MDQSPEKRYTPWTNHIPQYLHKYVHNGLINQDSDGKYSANKDYKFEDIKPISNDVASDKEDVGVKKVHSKLPSKNY